VSAEAALGGRPDETLAGNGHYLYVRNSFENTSTAFRVKAWQPGETAEPGDAAKLPFRGAMGIAGR